MIRLRLRSWPGLGFRFRESLRPGLVLVAAAILVFGRGPLGAAFLGDWSI